MKQKRRYLRSNITRADILFLNCTADRQSGYFGHQEILISNGADTQNDKKITVQKLNSYLNDNVPILSKPHMGSEQYPVTYGFGQDFPVVIVK